VHEGKRGGLIVFRIAQDGEGVACPKRLAETARRNAERSQRRLERRRVLTNSS
jgi:CRISPR/Cas system Type II protein with McrA/HNH and RuvC-like nuclease domain